MPMDTGGTKRPAWCWWCLRRWPDVHVRCTCARQPYWMSTEEPTTENVLRRLQATARVLR